MSLRRLGILQWLGVVVAPLAWTGQHVVGYGSGQARCSVAGMRWDIGFDTWQLAILAAAGLLVLASEAAAVTVFLATRETNYGDGPSGEGRWNGAVPYSRLHFFATAAMVANVLFFAVIFLDGLGSVFSSLCAQS
jgi:hypothetical protein